MCRKRMVKQVVKIAVGVLVSCVAAHPAISAHSASDAAVRDSNAAEQSRQERPTGSRPTERQPPQGVIPPQSPAALPAVAETNGDRGVGTKREGVTRIGVISPFVDFQGSPDSQALAVQLLTVVISYLQAPTLEVIPLAARVPAAAALEARTAACDVVLTVNATRTSAKAKGGVFGAARHLPIGMLPGVGAMAGSAGMIAAQAATVAASAAASLAASTQPKDTMTFEYTLSNVSSGAVVATNKRSAQAKQAGEDLITPMVSSMANTIVPQLLEPKQ